MDYLPFTFLIYGFICYLEFTSLRSKNSEGNQAFMNLAQPPPPHFAPQLTATCSLLFFLLSVCQVQALSIIASRCCFGLIFIIFNLCLENAGNRILLCGDCTRSSLHLPTHGKQQERRDEKERKIKRQGEIKEGREWKERRQREKKRRKKQ